MGENKWTFFADILWWERTANPPLKWGIFFFFFFSAGGIGITCSHNRETWHGSRVGNMQRRLFSSPGRIYNIFLRVARSIKEVPPIDGYGYWRGMKDSTFSHRSLNHRRRRVTSVFHQLEFLAKSFAAWNSESHIWAGNRFIHSFACSLVRSLACHPVWRRIAQVSHPHGIVII